MLLEGCRDAVRHGFKIVAGIVVRAKRAGSGRSIRFDFTAEDGVGDALETDLLLLKLLYVFVASHRTSFSRDHIREAIGSAFEGEWVQELTAPHKVAIDLAKSSLVAN